LGTVLIIATHDTELRRVPTMGSVVQMRLIRAIVLAIVVAVALLGGVAQPAYADTGPQSVAPAAAEQSAQDDPSDPLLPPD
jgi:hypothetical protein